MFMGIETHIQTPLAEAVRRAGSQSSFGKLIGRNQSTVFDWLRLNKPVPAELVIAVERETGVSRHDLRPDIYPVDQQPSSFDAEETWVRDDRRASHFDRADEMKRSVA